MELGWPRIRRRDRLQALHKENIQRTHPLEIQGERADLAVHRVPIGFPKYRLDNGRTVDKQAEYIARNPGKAQDFFRRDFESESAQAVQHALLRDLARDKNLIRHFRTKKQNQPLYLTEDGFVLNGNRRLCAWRCLLDEDSEKYKRFEYIEIIILPPMSPEELDELESTLQIEEDIKAEYKWTARACMLRERKAAYGYGERELARRARMKPGEVRNLLSILGEAELFLEELGKPFEYSRVEKSEFAFRQLVKQRSQIADEGTKELLTRAAFVLVEDPEDGRAYGSIKHLATHIKAVRLALEDELDITYSDDASDAKQIGQLGKAIWKKKNRELAREIIANQIDIERARDKARKRANSVVTQIQSARETLEASLASINEKSSRANANDELRRISDVVAKLSEWVNGHS